MKNNQVPERVIERIQKALNLANGNDDHEAQTSMLLAQKMMAKYGLEMEDVQTSNEQPQGDDIMEMYASSAERLIWWKKALAQIVGDNFRCYTVLKGRAGKTRVAFIGRKNDTKIAREVFIFAIEAVQACSLAYLRGQSVDGLSERSKIQNDYIRGFLAGLEIKFQEQVAQNGYEMVLVKDDGLVEYFDKKKLRTSARSEVSSAGDRGAYEQGIADGKNMDHNRKHLN